MERRLARRPRPKHDREVGCPAAGHPRHSQEPQPPPHQQRQPFSEAQLKTLKYHPLFPDRFGSLEDAQLFCRGFFAWYNHKHHHSGLALLTPADVHFGRAPARLAHRAEVLRAAYAAHPERFHCLPRPNPLPEAVWINPPQEDAPTTLP
jgi:putative transposase